MAVGPYRFSDDADELQQDKSIDVVIKQCQKFSVHEVHAVIENMNEHSDEEHAVVEVNDPVVPDSEHVGAATTSCGVMQSGRKKRKLLSMSGGKYTGPDSSEEECDDMESDDSADFINQLKTKLQTVAKDLEDSDGGRRTRKNRLSLKKAATNGSKQKCKGTPTADRTKNAKSSRRLTMPSDEGSAMPAVGQQKSATKWLENMEDLDHIEAVSDSDSGDSSDGD